MMASFGSSTNSRTGMVVPTMRLCMRSSWERNSGGGLHGNFIGRAYSVPILIGNSGRGGSTLVRTETTPPAAEDDAGVRRFGGDSLPVSQRRCMLTVPSFKGKLISGVDQ